MLMNPRSPYYLSDLQGGLRFTQTGVKALTPYFAMAGIDIRQINTIEEYQHAREQASPYFMSWLEQRIAKWPATPEFNLLKAATLGTPGETEKILQQLNKQQDGGHEHV